MKIEKLFKKAEKFFGMEKEEQEKNVEKRDKLIRLFQEKILSKKKKIKESECSEETQELKKEIEILKKLRDDFKEDEN